MILEFYNFLIQTFQLYNTIDLQEIYIKGILLTVYVITVFELDCDLSKSRY